MIAEPEAVGLEAGRRVFQLDPLILDPFAQALQVLEGVVAAFPEQGDVWAKSIQIDENNKVTCSGYARTQTAILSILDRLRGRKDISEVHVQQMRGANPVQFTFTFKSGAHDAK